MSYVFGQGQHGLAALRNNKSLKNRNTRARPYTNMNCTATKAFLSQLNGRDASITQIPPADLDYLSTSGYVLRTTKDDHDKGVNEVARLSQLTPQVNTERAEEEQAEAALVQDEEKEHSIKFLFEGKEMKNELRERIQSEANVVSKEESEMNEMEANVNSLIQEKSRIDRMALYDGGYLSLTGTGAGLLSDLIVRDYRVADMELPNFIAEIQATNTELRSIADKANFYVSLLRPRLPEMAVEEYLEVLSLLWGTAIGLGKLQGDPGQIGERFTKALEVLRSLHSTTSNKLMAAEVMTAAGGPDIVDLEGVIKDLDHQLRKEGVPEQLSAGIAATIMAGKRFDGSYPLDRFAQFARVTPSHEAASILAVMNVPYDGLSSKFQSFKATFASWGYTASDDTEIASALLAIGELGVGEVQEKLKYIVEQLHNYLEYPLVAAAILASIPVFEAHEVLDLMEKAVTLLSGYSLDLERSELVALAVRMIHGVRNELVKEIDPTAKISQTPVQFAYPTYPALLIWYHPVIIAHSYYHATFSGMGGYHPAHSHGVGGFAG